MNVLANPLPRLSTQEAETALEDVAAALRAGRIVPYLGPGILTLAGTAIPATPEALADFLGAKVALPKRARGNAWAAAQYIESTRHRATVTALMAEAFATPVSPTTLHRLLASLKPPMIVDTWYDGAMRAALSAAGDDWGEIQGITRAGIAVDQWYRFYDAGAAETTAAAASAWKTVLYKPHGSIAPAENFLISDADYVEVLTEIDIQTPIPDIVRERRTTQSFLFIGCRFHDQLLRTYARQLMKRSTGPHYAIVDVEALTMNEARFLAEQGVVALPLSFEQTVGILTSGAWS